MYIKFSCILRIDVFPIEKESIYRILGKFVHIFLMLIEMLARDDVAVRLLDKSCKYMEKTNSVVHRVMLHNFYTNMLTFWKYTILYCFCCLCACTVSKQWFQWLTVFCWVISEIWFWQLCQNIIAMHNCFFERIALVCCGGEFWDLVKIRIEMKIFIGFQ